MATKTTFNAIASITIENRDFSYALTKDDMSKNEWDKYLSICNKVAKTCYKYLSGKGTFEDYRGAIHSLFVFMGMDTRILALDSYVVSMNRTVPYVWQKSDAYKTACSNITKFKRAKNWAIEVSEVDEEQEDAILFPKAESVEGMVANYFDKETQDHYNLCIGLFKSALANGQKLTVKDVKDELARLEEVKDELARTPKQYYKDYKDPMKTGKDKVLKNVPSEIRKNIEDALADILSGRMTLTNDQLEKEEKQIKGGRK